MTFSISSKSNIYKNINVGDFEFLKTQNALRYTAYTVGIMPSLSFLEFGLGASYLDFKNFQIEPGNSQLIDKTGTNEWVGFVEPRLQIPFGKHVNVFGAWRATGFSDTNIKEKLLVFHNFKAGLGINFYKRHWDFSN